MERLRSEIKPDYGKKYDELPLGGCIELPLSMIKPITIDDYTNSHTQGPIEVFKNHSGIIYIDDGNHRYFDYLRKLRAENNYKEPDLNNFSMVVRKIYPKYNEWMI